MRKSTSSFLFPDLNVWLALSYQSHFHHRIAAKWLGSLSDFSRICFCRITQIGLLRLLTTKAVMNVDEVLTQQEAWVVYDQWLRDERIIFVDEPAELGKYFRALTQSMRPAPKDWTDSYLAAFAQSAGFQLVTFDRAFSQKSRNSILL